MQLSEEYFNRRAGLVNILLSKRVSGKYDEMKYIVETYPFLTEDEAKDLRWVYGTVLAMCMMPGWTIGQLLRALGRERDNAND